MAESGARNEGANGSYIISIDMGTRSMLHNDMMDYAMGLRRSGAET